MCSVGHRITEYPEVDGIHKSHQVQLLDLPRLDRELLNIILINGIWSVNFTDKVWIVYFRVRQVPLLNLPTFLSLPGTIRKLEGDVERVGT